MSKHIVSFSGGKDSTAMLLLMIANNMPIDKIIFVDTTKEFPGMYEHIKKVKRFVFPHIIETVKIDFDYWFSEHIKTKGKNKGKKGYGFPDFRNRWCTALKREAIKKHVGKNDIEYHGIAFDEQHRCKNNQGRNIKYPLVEWKVTEEKALRYCYDSGFDFSGLYKDFDRVSCYCCPLKRQKELKTLYKKYPELWSEVKKMEQKSFRTFRHNCKLINLENKFKDGADE